MARSWPTFGAGLIREPEVPTPEGQTRIYAIRGYADHGQLWAGPVDGAGWEWYRSALQTKVMDVPSDLYEQYETARENWYRTHRALSEACGYDFPDFPLPMDETP